MTYQPPQYPQQPQQPYPPQYQVPPPPGHPLPPQPGFGPPQPPPKMTGRNKVILAVAVVVMSTFVAAAVADKDEPASTAGAAVTEAAEASGPASALKAQPADEEKDSGEADSLGIPLGTKITYRDDGNVQTGVVRSVKTFKQGCNSLNVDPEQGLFVVVDVLVTQVKGKGAVNPLHFEFVADDGTSANALSAAFSGCDEPALASADLRAGQKRAGKIAFDIGMKAGTVEWTPAGLGGDTVGSWATK